MCPSPHDIGNPSRFVPARFRAAAAGGRFGISEVDCKLPGDTRHEELVVDWEAVGAIAELLAAIGVIGSLVYLAKQIKANSDNVTQNTRALISDRDVSSNEAILGLYGSQIENPDLAALVWKGHLAEALSPEERYRYNLVLTGMFESHQTFFIQHKKGSVSDELWDYYSNSVNRLCQFPGVVKWWTKHGPNFNPTFAEYIQKKVPQGA
jgi:hypothetical protein